MHVPKKSKTKSLGDALREAVIHSELTPYKIAKAAGIQANVLTRFLNGERDLRLATADDGIDDRLPINSLPARPTGKNFLVYASAF